jgi:hypothetical protein
MVVHNRHISKEVEGYLPLEVVAAIDDLDFSTYDTGFDLRKGICR